MGKIARYQLEDGRIARFEVPDDTTPEQAQAMIAAQLGNLPPPEAPPKTIQDRLPNSMRQDPVQGHPPGLVGAAEVAATVGSGALGEIASGIAGIGGAVAGGPQVGAQTVGNVQEAMTYRPRTPEGQQQLMSLASTLKPVADLMQQAEAVSGEMGYDIAGPLGGAIGETLPTAVLEAVGLAGGRLAGKAGRMAKASPDADTQDLLDAAQAADVPLMTSDVRPPKTYGGKFMQSVSERLGPLGSGSARASQQGAREQAVAGLVEQFDIDLDSPFAADIVRSIDDTLKAEIKRAGKMRDEAIKVLDPAGEVPLTSTRAAIAKVKGRQERLKQKADQSIIDNANDTLTSLEGGDFTQVKNIRTEVIDDIKALRKSDDARGVADLQKIKSAIDKDLLSFANKTDKAAAKKWVDSNRAFADAYTRAKDSEIKRVMMHGEMTPEKVIPILRGGRRSELDRIYNSMDPAGREAARRAILQDALKDSGFFKVDETPNPDAFATAMNRANRRQAVEVFFRGNARKEIDGLTRVLDATRRAQQSTTVVRTGEQIIPATAILGTGIGANMSLPATAAVVGGTAAVLKAYESMPFRKLLLKISNTPPGSPAEKRLLDLAASTAVAGLQAAKAPQEQEPQQ